jgi:hypothetical protein
VLVVDEMAFSFFDISNRSSVVSCLTASFLSLNDANKREREKMDIKRRLDGGDRAREERKLYLNRYTEPSGAPLSV